MSSRVVRVNVGSSWRVRSVISFRYRCARMEMCMADSALSVGKIHLSKVSMMYSSGSIWRHLVGKTSALVCGLLITSVSPIGASEPIAHVTACSSRLFDELGWLVVRPDEGIPSVTCADVGTLDADSACRLNDRFIKANLPVECWLRGTTFTSAWDFGRIFLWRVEVDFEHWEVRGLPNLFPLGLAACEDASGWIWAFWPSTLVRTFWVVTRSRGTCAAATATWIVGGGSVVIGVCSAPSRSLNAVQFSFVMGHAVDNGTELIISDVDCRLLVTVCGVTLMLSRLFFDIYELIWNW